MVSHVYIRYRWYSNGRMPNFLDSFTGFGLAKYLKNVKILVTGPSEPEFPIILNNFCSNWWLKLQTNMHDRFDTCSGVWNNRTFGLVRSNRPSFTEKWLALFWIWHVPVGVRLSKQNRQRKNDYEHIHLYAKRTRQKGSVHISTNLKNPERTVLMGAKL